VIVILVPLTWVNVTEVAPTKTLVAPARLAPVMVRVAPLVNLVPVFTPVTDVTVGFWITVTESTLVTAPPGVVTVTVPVTAPVGTAKLIEVAPLVKPVIAFVPNLTADAASKLTPVTVTVPPIAADEDTEVIEGTSANAFFALTVPPAVVTEILPSVAPAGTAKVRLFTSVTVKSLISNVPSFTNVAAPTLVPVTVTVSPITPLAVDALIVGADFVVFSARLPADVEEPRGFVTTILPVMAAAGLGKAATILVDDTTFAAAVAVAAGTAAVHT
jgi:hypothetical protein